MSKKILISAIETSGDMHAANLVKEIQKITPDISFYGFGSEQLAAAGVDIRRDISDKSSIGIIEPLKHLFSFLKDLSYLKKLLKDERPDAFLCIDGQGFHVPAAAYAKKLGIPVIYYIAPQEWLWGTEKGGRKVAAVCDLIVGIFPEEAAYYHKLGTRSCFYGHPLTDIVKASLKREEFFKKYALDPQKKLIGIFPGSRKQELKFLLPEFIKTVELLGNKYNYVIAAANKYSYNHINKDLPANIRLITNETHNTLYAADIILSSTGTITLEAALAEVPVVAAYKFDTIAYQVFKFIIGRRAPRFLALPNMIADKEIIPEIIQYNVTAETFKDKLEDLLSNPEKYSQIKKDLHALAGSLNKENVLTNIAEEIKELLMC